MLGQTANLGKAGPGKALFPTKPPDLSHWYVIQVKTLGEEAMCRQIERACAEYDDAHGDARVGLRECFSPRYKSQKKWKGEWKDVERCLLPGYVIADVQGGPASLAEAVRSIRGLCRLVASGESYVPLSDNERTWIEGQTQKGDRVIPMSFAYKVGAKIVVTDGPLKNREAQIARIDRANSLAFLEFHVGQMTIKTSVGLAVLPTI